MFLGTHGHCLRWCGNMIIPCFSVLFLLLLDNCSLGWLQLRPDLLQTLMLRSNVATTSVSERANSSSERLCGLTFDLSDLELPFLPSYAIGSSSTTACRVLSVIMVIVTLAVVRISFFFSIFYTFFLKEGNRKVTRDKRKVWAKEERETVEGGGAKWKWV